MVKPLRIEVPGATCHVLGRGDQGRKICVDDHDRELWPATLVQAWKRTVNRRWVAERLAMGHETRASQAVSLVESSRQGGLQRLKEKLTRYEVSIVGPSLS